MKANFHNPDSDKIKGKDNENFVVSKVIEGVIQLQNTAENKLMVSQYKNFNLNKVDRNLLDIFDEIQSGKYKSEIYLIRESLDKGDEVNASRIKNGLTAFTTSGTFSVSRTKENLITYSQILCLDFDHILGEELEILREIINECEYTFASFISPSGLGLKVFIKVNTNSEQHSTAYNQVANYYKVLSGYEFDPKCKDIPRLCYVSYDPELSINGMATTFEVIEEDKSSYFEPKREIQYNFSADDLSYKCLKFTEQKELYYKGNRNNFIYLFASNAIRFGIHEDETLSFCINNFDLEVREIKTTVSAVYKNQSSDFAKFAKFANMQSLNSNDQTSIETDIELQEDVLKTTPLIPQFVYDNLPPILFESCDVFKEPRERDVYLTGALAILSGCLPNVSGLYSGSMVYSSLFSFILAPAASGKGALKFAKALADKYHNKTLAQSIDDKKTYNEKIAAQKASSKKGKITSTEEMPENPKFKVVFIPANTSNAKVIQHLDDNGGRGIICETEADTLGQTFKSEWGSYSDMLRKSFHHEKISVSRKTDSEFVEVNEPQLSVALSGTPKQVFNIISSAEDGLFSRFIFYVFKTDPVWLDPSPKGNPINLTQFFDKQSSEVLKMVEFFDTEEMELHLTEEQWAKFNPIFSSFLHQISDFVSDDAQSIVKRLGLILYRFCMIFTAIRKYSSKTQDREIFCLDVDFEIALELINTYLAHSVIMFNNLPKQGEQGSFRSGQNKEKFLEALPIKFQRKEAVEVAKNYGISERSVDSFLKACLGKYLVQPKTGYYEKIN